MRIFHCPSTILHLFSNWPIWKSDINGKLQMANGKYLSHISQVASEILFREKELHKFFTLYTSHKIIYISLSKNFHILTSSRLRFVPEFGDILYSNSRFSRNNLT
jgi:hypothetical protein